MSAPPLHRLLGHLRRRARPHDPGLVSDRDLLAAYVGDGDQAAFAELVRRHGAMVQGVARRVLGDAHAAEDVGQATFLVLARRAPAGWWIESVGGWLHGVAYRLALKARAAARRPVIVGEPRKPPAEPDAEVANRELRALLDSELRALPARYRAPLVLCYLEGRTRDEAARQLGVSVAAVKGRLERGRDVLRERLTRRGCCLGVGLTAAALAEGATAAPPTDHWAAVATGAKAVPAAAERLASAAVLTVRAGRWALAAGLLGLAAATAGLALGVGIDPTQPPAPPPVPRAAARTDRFGDPLPDGAKARLGTLRWRAGGSTNQVTFSRDGKLVIAGTSEGVQFWDAATGRPLDRIPRSFDHVIGVGGVALSPDGTTLATGSLGRYPTGTVHLWDVTTGREKPFPKQDLAVLELAFAPDGKTLAGRLMQGGEVMLWEVPSGKVIGRLNHQKEGDPPGEEQVPHVAWVAYAPSGRALYTADNRHRQVSVWDTATGKLARTIPLPEDTLPIGHALSPDGTTIATASIDWITLIDVASGRTTRQIETGGRRYFSLVYADHGKVLAGRSQQGVDFYDVASGRRAAAVAVPRSPGGSLYAEPSGSRVILSYHGQHAVHVWDAATGHELSDPTAYMDGIAALAVAADGRTLLSAARDGDQRVRRWDIADGKELPAVPLLLPRFLGEVVRQATAFSPSGRFLVWKGLEAGGRGRTGRTVPAVQGKDGKLIPLRPLPPMREIITVAETATGRAVQTFEAPQGRSATLALSPDGKTLAADAAGHGVQLWDTATGTPGRKLTADAWSAHDLAFSPDGQTLAVAYDGPPAVWVWDVSSGEVRRKIPVPQDGGRNAPASVAFAPDGRTLAAAVSRGVRRWEVATGKELPALDGPKEGVSRCGFSPDGKLVIASGVDGSVWAWDAATGRVRHSSAGHRHAVTGLVLTPDGKTLATGSADTTILLWDVAGW
jgi:RNA polymerase sigma factor (sigma-70 family)